MRNLNEHVRGSSSILSLAFFGISFVAVSSVAISSDSIVLRSTSVYDSCALNYNALSNPKYDLKVVKLTFALGESRRELEMEPWWEHDQARGGGSKGSQERGSRTMQGVGWIKTSQGVGGGGARPRMGWRPRSELSFKAPQSIPLGTDLLMGITPLIWNRLGPMIWKRLGLMN
jgi:hypothetical protein